jgi:Xaa-Pro aminopeptidase
MRTQLLTPLLAAVLATSALAQEARVFRLPFGENATRAADGAAVCGLGKDWHAGRRAELARRLKSGIVVLRGLPDPRASVAFRQDKNFWYLTGIESPGVALVLDLDRGEEVLFVAKPSAFKESWAGEIWDADDAWVRELTGIEDVRANDAGRGGNRDLLDCIDAMVAADPERPIWTVQTGWIALSGAYDSSVPYDQARRKDSLDGRESREEALARHLRERYADRGVEVRDLTPELWDMRVIKTPEEVEAVRRASRAAAHALREAMRSTRPGLGEWDLDALLTWQQRRAGADGPAYAPIVGSGANSLVLHYNFSSRRMRAGEVVLVDFAPEVDHFVSDVTRTWPVAGTFDERMVPIYDAVLAAQEAAIAAVRPGAAYRDIGRAATQVLRERGYSCPHGVCHSVGMAVHDPGKMGGELRPGMIFTIEPGVYDKETGIGVRIEDVVLVTEEGCEVLSADCPKSRAEIEALMAEKGILDLVDSK